MLQILTIARPHIMAIGAMGVLTFGWIFSGQYFWFLAVIAAVDWFVVNWLNRVVDLEEDTRNHISGTAFVAQHSRAFIYTGLAALISSAIATLLIAPEILPLRICFHLLGLAYNWPLLPAKWFPRHTFPAAFAESPDFTTRKVRIKQLYFWKNTASATGFLLTVFGFPLVTMWRHDIAWANGSQPVAALWAVVYFFVFEISYEIMYDMRDVAGDAAEGIQTYPVFHGIDGAIDIVHDLLLASFVWLVVGFLFTLIPWCLAILAAAPIIQAIFFAWMRHPHSTTKDIKITAGQCIALTWLGVSLLVTYHFWYHFGLPGSDW